MAAVVGKERGEVVKAVSIAALRVPAAPRLAFVVAASRPFFSSLLLLYVQRVEISLRAL